ncbi:MAG: hypothetical protein J5929_05570 [Eubacterium sp.]|nr:hypothetical protein [Eubacterium sp.]
MIINCLNKTPNFKIDAPPSKSIYHRELIVRYLLMNSGDSTLKDLTILPGDNEDIRATKSVLSALYDAAKSDISASVDSSNVDSANVDSANINSSNEAVYLPCNESGSTLRFMIPVAAAYSLGKGRNHHGVKRLIFETKGRLFDRPLDELEAALKPHGITIEKDSSSRCIIVSGEMTPGEYTIDGSVSSQYISGLIMALTLFDEPCKINVTGEMKSVHYIVLTLDVLKKYGCEAEFKDGSFYPMTGGYLEQSNKNKNKNKNDMIRDFKVEGDWSNGAFLLCLKKWSDIEVTNLNPDSRQGDRAIVDYLKLIDDVRSKAASAKGVVWDCTDIPDITPYMATVAPFVFDDITFTGVSRLRIKESDRVMAVREQLAEIGVKTEETEDSLTVYRYSAGKETISNISSDLSGDKKIIRLSSYNDHRMAMCAVLIATILKTEIELDDISCIKKSFPEFLEYIEKYYA